MLLPQAQQASGALQADSIDAISAQLLALLQSERGADIMRQAVSEVVSKRQYDALVPEETVNTDELLEMLAQGAVLQADYSSRILYNHHDDNVTLYVNGQRVDGLDDASAALLIRLADGDSISATDVVNIDPDEMMEWLENGWVWLSEPE